MVDVSPEGAAAPRRVSREELRPLFLSLRHRSSLDADVEAGLASMFDRAERFQAGQAPLRKGQRVDRSMLVMEGLLCRYQDFPDGTRQITALHLPGDFVDLQSYTLPLIDHDVMALSNCRLAMAPHAEIGRVLDADPRVARLLWMLTNLDAAIYREWELSLGARSAFQRAAHLFCEMHARLELTGRTKGSAFPLPLTQVQLSQCLALSPVHTNRVLRELRERELLQFARGHVRIPDLSALRLSASFDPAYLHIASA